jgi:hypothetical protein
VKTLPLTVRSAVAAIEKMGMCLVYPIDNQRSPDSLWYTFFPRTKMVWEWDSGADRKVADLWLLREELSRSGKVVYVKWYRDRATFFSKSLFVALVNGMHRAVTPPPLGREAHQLLSILEDSSPRSTKELRLESGLLGRPLEGIYSRALRTLWRRFYIVGYGEVDDGAFPSLAMGSTRLMFESLWEEAMRTAPEALMDRREAAFCRQPLLRKQFLRFQAG